MQSFKKFREIEVVIVEDVEYEFNTPILSEAVHERIQSILDSGAQPVDNKLALITKQVRSLIAEGRDTGLENDKPKKGSSRAVFFPSEHKEIELDGQRVHIPTAVKIAFPGQLDKYRPGKQLLGEMQNTIEDTDDYAVIRQIHGHSNIRVSGDVPKFETYHAGVTIPLLNSHQDGHYLEMARAEKYNAKDLRNYTKHPDFKKGVSHEELTAVLQHHHSMAHGGWGYGNQTKNNILQEHPHVDNMIRAMNDMGMHPADLHRGNMGIWEHPLTKVRHPVIIDYGFSNEVAKEYQAGRQAMYEKQRQIRRGY